MPSEVDGKKVACAHDGEPFGSRICTHLKDCSTPWLSYFRWYTGTALNAELLCQPCAEARAQGATITASAVCESCFRNATQEMGDLVGVRGQPEIHIRAEPFERVMS